MFRIECKVKKKMKKKRKISDPTFWKSVAWKSSSSSSSCYYTAKFLSIISNSETIQMNFRNALGLFKLNLFTCRQKFFSAFFQQFFFLLPFYSDFFYYKSSYVPRCHIRRVVTMMIWNIHILFHSILVEYQWWILVLQVCLYAT